MLIVKIDKDKNLENALKNLKNKVQKTKMVQELRSRQEFVKPSVRRRSEILKAIYVEKKRTPLND
jgi:small subunit ribosomal protein S21